jgi:hypothetical protein
VGVDVYERRGVEFVLNGGAELLGRQRLGGVLQ